MDLPPQQDARCMHNQCGRPWTREHLLSVMGPRFVNDHEKWLGHRKDMTFQREQARLPDVQGRLRLDIVSEAIGQRVRDLKAQIVYLQARRAAMTVETVHHVEREMQGSLSIGRAVRAVRAALTGRRGAAAPEPPTLWEDDALFNDGDGVGDGDDIFCINDDDDDRGSTPSTSREAPGPTTSQRPAALHECPRPKEECRGYLVDCRCQVCGARVCKRCEALLLPATAAARQPHECKSEDLLSAETKRTSCKPCPRCRVPIYRTSGCYQMWCTACHCLFSWSTGEELQGPNIVIHNPHFHDFMHRRRRARAGGDVGDDDDDMNAQACHLLDDQEVFPLDELRRRCASAGAQAARDQGAKLILATRTVYRMTDWGVAVDAADPEDLQAVRQDKRDRCSMMYIMRVLSEDEYKTRLQALDKKFDKEDCIFQCKRTLRRTLTDILSALPEMSTAAHLQGTLNELHEARHAYNDAMEHTRRVYGSTVKILCEDWSERQSTALVRSSPLVLGQAAPVRTRAASAAVRKVLGDMLGHAGDGSSHGNGNGNGNDDHDDADDDDQDQDQYQDSVCISQRGGIRRPGAPMHDSMAKRKLGVGRGGVRRELFKKTRRGGDRDHVEDEIIDAEDDDIIDDTCDDDDSD